MNFGSSNKVLNPQGAPSPHVAKNNTPLAPPMISAPMHLKRGTVSMSNMINIVTLKIHTDLVRLIEFIRSVGDSERKTEIVKFLSSSRSLLIRLQALNKWTTSASKVDKCDKISNLLDEQSSFLHKTSADLSVLFRERLPNARLPNIMPIIAADIFATKTYSRLPNHIKQSVMRTQPITKKDKRRMFDQLDRILKIRLSNTKLPMRMRNIEIKNGRVTFRVENEFVATCTLLSDHFEHPWRLLNVEFLVQGGSVCRGRSLVHRNHLRDVHRQVHNRLQTTHNETYPALMHLYDMMHDLSLCMQLEVLNEQLRKYVVLGQGAPVASTVYIRGSRLSFLYWQIDSKFTRPKHTITISVDDEDIRRPLKVKHSPPLSADDRYLDRQLDSRNLSIKNLIGHTLTLRIHATLEIVQRLLFPFLLENKPVSRTRPQLLLPLLGEHCLLLQVAPSTGEVLVDVQTGPLDLVPSGSRLRIRSVLKQLATDVNHLLLRSYGSASAVDSAEYIDVIAYRRKIGESVVRLRVVLAALGCYRVLHHTGFRDLNGLFYKPALEPLRPDTASARRTLYELRDQETKGDCELIYIPLSGDSDYYLVVQCLTEHRCRPEYRLYELQLMKTYGASNSAVASERQWVMRLTRFARMAPDALRNILNKKAEPDEIAPVKRQALTCADLIKKKMRLTDGSAVPTDSVVSDQPVVEQRSFDINDLPVVISYLKESIVYKQLINEMSTRGMKANFQKINNGTQYLSVRISQFPNRQATSPERSGVLLNKLLHRCTVHYVSESAEQPNAAGAAMRWHAHFQLSSPLHLLQQQCTGQHPRPSHGGSGMQQLLSRQIMLSHKGGVHDCATGIRIATDSLLTLWHHMTLFVDACFLPLFDNSQILKQGFTVSEMDDVSMTLRYGPDQTYSATVSQVSGDSSGLFQVSLACSGTSANPHCIIRKDLEIEMNKTRDINTVLKTLQETLSFLEHILPYYELQPLISMLHDYQHHVSTSTATPGASSQPSLPPSSAPAAPSPSASSCSPSFGAAQLLRQYALIVLEPYHCIIVYRERFALNLEFLTTSKTVRLSDAHYSFHACNMSIRPMPHFQKFMDSLEKVFRLDIEDETWSGLAISQLPNVLGRTPGEGGLLAEYLDAASQLTSAEVHGEREELVIPLPCNPPTGSTSAAAASSQCYMPQGGPEVKVGLDNVIGGDHLPHWQLVLSSCVLETAMDRSWVQQHHLMEPLRVIFQEKVVHGRCRWSGNALTVFKRLLQLPSWKLQKNLVELLQQGVGREMLLDLDWEGSRQPAISHQSQDPSSIALHLLVRPPTVSHPDKQQNKLEWPLVLHYAAKSNQIYVLAGTHPAVQALALDKEANDLGVTLAGDTPLPDFVSKLRARIPDLVTA